MHGLRRSAVQSMGLPDRASGGRAGLHYVCSPFDVTGRVELRAVVETGACLVLCVRHAPYALRLRGPVPGACTELCTVVLLV